MIFSATTHSTIVLSAFPPLYKGAIDLPSKTEDKLLRFCTNLNSFWLR